MANAQNYGSIVVVPSLSTDFTRSLPIYTEVVVGDSIDVGHDLRYRLTASQAKGADMNDVISAGEYEIIGDDRWINEEDTLNVGTVLLTDFDATGFTLTTSEITNLYTEAGTFTNKRWTARVGNTTSSATPTINTDNYDIYKLTAQSEAITSFTTNLSGTPVDGDILEIQITGTAARAIAWGTSFVASTVALPTTTVTTATLSVIFQFYTTSSYGNSKWVCVNSF